MATNPRRRSSQKESSRPALWSAGLLGFALLIVAVVWWRGGKQYPEVSTPQSMELMRALYTACSSQNPTRLAAVERELDSAYAAGQVGDVERQAFLSIISLAKQDQWSRAAAEAYRFAQDQVR